MTIGSPLDKHLLLWPRLWNKFDDALAQRALPAGQIQWRNYYDFGDPVGFKLDSTRLWLAHQKIAAFEFCGCQNCRHDIGFARYLLPGAAHNEYWNDADLFEHFISNVVKNGTAPAPGEAKPAPTTPPPQSKPLIVVLSPTLPYVFSFLVLMLGVFVLFKAVYAYANPSLDALQKFVRFEELGVYPPDSLHGWQLLSAVVGVTGLIAGATLLARFPRLAVGKRWLGAGFVALLVGCGMYVVAVDSMVRNDIGDSFWYMRRWFGPAAPTLGILGLTAVAGMSGYLAMSRNLENPDRRQRWFLRGTRPLIICGSIGIGLVILSQLYPRNINGLWKDGNKVVSFSASETALIKRVGLSPNELWQLTTNNPTGWAGAVQKVEPLITPTPSIWPVVLAGGAFLYLWWLAMLLFDLSFVWQRYIRRSITIDRLREWNPYGFPPRWDGNGGEPCRKLSTRTVEQ